MIQEVMTGAGRRYSVFGKRFDSKEAAEMYQAETIARRTKYAGRELSPRELMIGLAKPDDREPAQKIADAKWQPITGDEKPADDNPFRRARLEPKEPKTRKQLMAKAERDWDAKRAEAEKQAAMAADPERQQYVAWAEEVLERMTYSDAPYSVQVKAEQLLRQAQSGSLDHFRTMADEFVERDRAIYQQKKSAAEQQLRAAEKQYNELTPPTAPTVKGRIERVRYGDGEDYFVVTDGDRIISKHRVDAAPPEILQQYENQ